MPGANNYPRIVTDETLLEQAAHGDDAFPFQYYLEDTYAFDLHCVDWHWHPELELVYVRKGALECLVGSERHLLGEGFGLFVNSRVVHRFQADAPNETPNAVFSPALLAPEGSLIHRKYVLPLLEEGPPCLVLDPGVPWQAAALENLRALLKLQEGDAPDELGTVRLLLALLDALYRHAERRSPASGQPEGPGPARLQVMMQFIHERYREDLSLDDIAGSVFISRSSALQVFQEGIGLSPVAYLIRYRLQRAAALLGGTEKSVAAIAEETGFRSAGYFCRRFRGLFGASPGAYRLGKRREGAG